MIILASPLYSGKVARARLRFETSYKRQVQRRIHREHSFQLHGWLLRLQQGFGHQHGHIAARGEAADEGVPCMELERLNGIRDHLHQVRCFLIGHQQVPVEVHQQHGQAIGDGFIRDLRRGARVRGIAREAGEEDQQGFRFGGDDQVVGGVWISLSSVC